MCIRCYSGSLLLSKLNSSMKRLLEALTLPKSFIEPNFYVTANKNCSSKLTGESIITKKSEECEWAWCMVIIKRAKRNCNEALIPNNKEPILWMIIMNVWMYNAIQIRKGTSKTSTCQMSLKSTACNETLFAYL